MALLTCLAGADASATMKALVWDSGASGVVSQLDWLGTPEDARLAAPPVSWEDDPWARGGYAVFGPGFDAGGLVRLGGYVVEPLSWATLDEGVV